MAILHRDESSNYEAKQFGRFLLVGMSGTLIDFTLLTLLKLAGLPTLLANTISFSGGVINNFTWSRRWTFAETAKKDIQQQFPQFLVVSLVGLLINNSIVFLLEAQLGSLLNEPNWGYLPAKAVATAVVVFWNYLANKYWTFRNS